MKYSFTNITGRASLTQRLRSGVLVIDGKPVRAEETRIFDVPTADICWALEGGSIAVLNTETGQAVKSIDGFEGTIITRTETKQRIQTVDGFRFSTIASFEIIETSTGGNLNVTGTLSVEEVVSDVEAAPELADETAPEVEVEPIAEPVVEDVEVFEDETDEDATPDAEIEEEGTVSDQTFSADLNAKNAVAFIESASDEDLVDFLSEDEARKSVLRAWSTRFDG
jgi:hypothetical protein